jgi:hypothetical protein
VTGSGGINWATAAAVAGAVGLLLSLFSGWALRLLSSRSRVIGKVTQAQMDEAGRRAAEAVAAGIKEQFKGINDHLVSQDNRINSMDVRLGRIEGRLGVPKYRVSGTEEKDDYDG